MTQCLFAKYEVFHCEAEGYIRVESNLVKDAIKLFLGILVENVSVLWLVRKVDLKVASWLDILELFVFVHLTFNHGEHTVAYAHNRKMLIVLIVVTLSPVEYLLYHLGVGEVAVRDEGLRITRNIQSIQLAQLVLHLLFVLIKVDGNNAGTCTFQEFYNRCFNKLLAWVRVENIVSENGLIFPLVPHLILDSQEFLVPFAFSGQGLCQNADDWVLGFLANMMSGADHWRVVHSIVHTLWIIIML